ncbi:FAD:protein FMN transferase [Aliiruegeria lutimaris]|uniref:FAD:protein FMN transferase n=1 Tax=Aliiruegeria lutimaris TaxID=571298 RepID=A0A1G8KKU6_9RHOB|nr:FAD:protein FMN transferase [Aliiruegeria lutimaris]SDI44034.1 thiamine biosynthesis lipoprotein [Aliiruegeria lutimaris]
MISSLTRRRFLAISASAAAAPALASQPAAYWRGLALGAGASMQLAGLATDRAAPVFSAVEAELRRLEAIFSLHRRGSAIDRLNRDGRLDHPPAELLEVLTLAGRLHDVSGGAFDPTIQPLWELQAARAVSGYPAKAGELSEALKRTGWRHLRMDTRQIAFARPAMALTLNGIAQGYITDWVASLLHARGLHNILIDMGEIVASGTRSDGAAWVSGVARPDGRVIHKVQLRDRALATSSPSGTLLDPRGEVGHILHPETGLPAMGQGVVSVSAPRAALADGLSTACCLLSAEGAATAVTAFPDARLEVIA